MKTTVGEAARVLRGPGSPAPGDRSMGAMLIDAGRITPEDAERILRYAKEKGVRFGDAAVALKLATEDDIQQTLAKQFDYPYLVPGESQVDRSVVAAWDPFSKQVEQLRAVRSQLLLRWFTGHEGREALAVVSSARGDGRSYLAANLAVVFSQMGERTLLVDADLRNSRQHALFGLQNQTGLSTVLSDRAGLEAIQRVPAFVDLSLLTAGPTPPNPSELLGRPAYSKLMTDLASNFDVVIVDTAAASLGSDFLLAASRARAALLVVRLNRTTAAECESVRETLTAAGAPLVGSVLNEG